MRSRIVRSTAVQQRAVEQLERATEDQLVQVEGPDHRSQGDPDLDADLGQRVGSVGGQPLAQPRRGQHGLEAAAATAGALGAVRVDHDVADLAGRRAVAVQQGALEHQPGAHTGADPDQHQPAVTGVAEGVLAEHGGVGVVRHEDRDVERRPQPLGQRRAVPAEVGRVHDHAGGVHDAGCADADAEHRPGGGVDQLPDDGVDQRDGVLAAATLQRPAAPLLDVAGEVEQGPRDDPVGGEVDGHDLAGLPGQLHQHRGLADPALDRVRGPTLPLGEQPLGDQAGDDVGDGDPGQPAGAGQVGPAGRAVAEQQLQQQRPVVTPGVLGTVPARGAQRPADRSRGRRHVC